MDDNELHSWVDSWAAQYPAADDDVLASLAGVRNLDRDLLITVIKWKIEPRWQPGIFKRLSEEPDERIATISRRAFACNDSLGALLILQQLEGVGPALASAILMAQDQIRYTVMDMWAVSSLCWLEELPQGTEVGSGMWSDYLDACHGIAHRTGESLRVVDRALYTGRGRPAPAMTTGMPS